MRLRSTAYLLLAAATLVIAGCCNNPTEYHYAIPPAIKAMVPYNALSSFEMRHSTGRRLRFTSIHENLTEFSHKGCSSCCSEEFSENYSNYLKSDSAGMELRINLLQDGEEGVADPARLEIDFAGAKFFAEFTDSTCSAQSSMECVDSIYVAGHLYHDVFLLHNQSTSGNAAFSKLYYDKSWGVIRLDAADATLAWELIR